MNRRIDGVRLARIALPLVGLALQVSGAARADIPYKIQPIVKVGDVAGDVPLPSSYRFSVEGLNDSGQILIVAFRDPEWDQRMLLQYSEGTLIPIAVAERDAPGGKWPRALIVRRPLNMNQKGNVAFNANITINGKTSEGTFLWDANARQVKVIALKGMPAPESLTFEQGGGPAPKINNHDEIVFPAIVKNRGSTGHGLFFLGRDGKLQAVVLPGQAAPGGGTIQNAQFPVLNDAGRIAFPAWRGDTADAYLWENGTLTVIARSGTMAPDGGRFVDVFPIQVSHKDGSVILDAALRLPERHVFYRFVGGQFTPLLTLGQEMPGGGRLKDGVFFSDANDAGQHALTATLEDGSSGLYLLEPDGKLSLLLKSGTATELGTITRIGKRAISASWTQSQGIGLNNKGQIALPLRFDSGPDTVVLLTPTSP